MKGIINIIEVMLTGIILILAFYHFFPQYVIRPHWDRALLSVKIRDVLNTIDRLNKTYEFAESTTEFNSFMGNVLKPEYHGAMVWWKETKDLESYTEDMEIPYFTQGYKETMVDVEPVGYSVGSNTVALWHFDEVSGPTANDESPNNNDGNLVNMDDTNWVSGKFGNALHFGGVDECVEVSDDPSLDFAEGSELTLETWFYAYSFTPGKWAILIMKEETNTLRNYALYTSQADPRKLRFSYYNGGYNILQGTTILSTDTWYHAVATYDSNTNTGKLYINGKDESATWMGVTGAADLITNDGTLLIGSDKNVYNNYFNGIIDEVIILNRTLSDDEVKAHFFRYDVYSFTLGLGYPY